MCCPSSAYTATYRDWDLRVTAFLFDLHDDLNCEETRGQTGTTCVALPTNRLSKLAWTRSTDAVEHPCEMTQISDSLAEVGKLSKVA